MCRLEATLDDRDAIVLPVARAALIAAGMVGDREGEHPREQEGVGGGGWVSRCGIAAPAADQSMVRRDAPQMAAGCPSPEAWTASAAARVAEAAAAAVATAAATEKTVAVPADATVAEAAAVVTTTSTSARRGAAGRQVQPPADARPTGRPPAVKTHCGTWRLRCRRRLRLRRSYRRQRLSPTSGKASAPAAAAELQCQLQRYDVGSSATTSAAAL